MNLISEFTKHAQNLLSNFTGREWLVERTREFLNNPDSPHFLLIEGEPGIGKSAFAAYLWQVKQIPHVVHFCIAKRDGTIQPLSFIESIAEQLSLRLPGFEKELRETAEMFERRNININISQRIKSVSGTVTGVKLTIDLQGIRPSVAFDRLIRVPLQKLDDSGLPQTVILVDSLDEAITFGSDNIVDLLICARDLPPQVRFILTTRVIIDIENRFDDVPKVVINAQSMENQRDIVKFLDQELRRNESLQEMVAKIGWSQIDFRQKFSEISEWNFLYLTLVLNDISNGKIRLDEDELPSGLNGYYRDLAWSRIGNENWEAWTADLLEVVLALQEPVPMEQIANYLGWTPRKTSQRLIQICQLLNPSMQKENRYWRYHQSVTDFFCDRDKAGEYWCDIVQGNKRIIDYYFTEWGGMNNNLSELQNEEKRNLDHGYGLRSIVAHLENARRIDELHQLFVLETPKGRNAWFEAKDAEGDISSYLADVERAIKLVELELNRDRQIEVLGKSIELLCRYSLINASIKSMAANFSSELILALVENGIWSFQKGLTYIRKFEAYQLYDALIGIFRFCTNDMQDKIFEMIFATLQFEIKMTQLFSQFVDGEVDSHDFDKLYLLAKKLPVGKRDEFLRREVLEEEGQIENIYIHATRLILLAEQLPENERAEVLEEALKTTRQIGQADERADKLISLAEQLPKEKRAEILIEAREAVRNIINIDTRAKKLILIAGQLPEEERVPVLIEAREVARKIKDDGDRADRLIALVRLLPKDDRQDLLQEIHKTVSKIKDAAKCAERLISLAEQLPEEEQTDVLGNARKVIRKISYDSARVAILILLARQLPDKQRIEVLEEAQETARKIENAYARAAVLISLAGQLPEEKRAKVLDEVREVTNKIKYANDCVGSFEWLLPGELLQEAREAAEKVKYSNQFTDWLKTWELPEELLQETQEVVREIQSARGVRIAMLRLLAKQLPKKERIEVLDEACEVARRIEDVHDHAVELIYLIKQLPEEEREELLREARETVKRIESANVRATLLLLIARQLPQGKRAEILIEVRKATKEIEDPHHRATILFLLAEQHPERERTEVLEEVREVARKINYPNDRADRLILLAERLPEKERIEVIEEAREAAREIDDAWGRARRLISLAEQLHERERVEVLLEVLKATSEIKYLYGFERLISLAGQLSEKGRVPVLIEVREVARKIKDAGDRAQWLFSLAEQLPERERAEVLVEAQEAILIEALKMKKRQKDAYTRTHNLILLAEKLQAGNQGKLLQEARRETRKIESAGARAEMLVLLAEKLSGKERVEVLIEARETVIKIEDTDYHAKMLISLAGQLPEEEKLETLEEARKEIRKIKKIDARVEMLLSLAEQLPEKKRVEVLGEARDVAREIGEDSEGRIEVHKFDELLSLNLLKSANCIDLNLSIIIILNYFRALNSENRLEVIKSLGKEVPIFREIVGVTVIKRLSKTIPVVLKWWP
jgi:hypothetical protein